jgi:ubiquinone/menaquinone biosynthesis C-methylase UbiE
MPRPGRIRFLSRTAPFYDPAVQPLGFRRLWESLARLAEQGAGTLCLDVCTGTGGVARALARRGSRVIGFDLSPGMLRHARRKARAAGIADRTWWVQMDARQIAFRDDSFPLVICSMSFHEMAEEERGQVLEEMKRVASDQVILADYRVPTSGWQRLLFPVFRIFERLESEDFDGFISVDLGERLEAAGLAVEAHWHSALYGVWPCSVRRSPDGS